jgi:hypothetical protein
MLDTGRSCSDAAGATEAERSITDGHEIPLGINRWIDRETTPRAVINTPTKLTDAKAPTRHGRAIFYLSQQRPHGGSSL